MSESFYDELEGLIGKHREKEAAEKQKQENDERFERLEQGIGAIGEKIEEAFSKPPAAGNSEPSAGEGGEGKPSGRQVETPPENEPENENLDVERIKRLGVPHIYQGDDEPEIVQYVDADDGETKTRKGRRKNHPTMYDVEIVMPEPIDRPQEPAEETG